MEDLDQLFNEALTHVSKSEVGNYAPYGRGQCNTMLGNARDSLDILYEAIAYIKKHRGV